MGRHFHCTDEIIVVSKGKEDIGKVPTLGNDGRLDPSVIPGMGSTAIAGLAKAKEHVPLVCNQLFIEIPLKDVLFDQGNLFESDGKIHVKQNGVYCLAGQVYFNYSSCQKGSAGVDITKNGASIAGSSACPNPTTRGLVIATAVIVKLKEGDVVDIRASTSGTDAGTIDTIPDATQLSIARLGD